MKYKYFIFSDIHGELDALNQALKEAGYTGAQDQKLVCLGDFTDRGPKSMQAIDFLRQVDRRGNLIRVKGNHDEFLIDFINNGKTSSVVFNMLYNGLDETLHSIMEYMWGPTVTKQFSETGKPKDLLEQTRLRLIEDGIGAWLKKAPLYYETKHMIFSHAGIDPTLLDWKQTSEKHFLWDIKDTWVPCERTNKLVIIGHHHARQLRRQAEERGFTVGEILIAGTKKFSGIKNAIQAEGNDRIYVLGNKIGLDALTNLTHKVNILVVEDEEMGG